MKHLTIAIVLICGLLAAGPVQSAEIDALKAIPPDVLGFALINRLDKTNEKLAKVAQLVQAPPIPLLMLAKMQTGLQAGIDDAGTAAVVMMPPSNSNGPPAVAILLPVKDYKALVAQLQPEDPAATIAKVKLMGSPWLVGKKGDFAALMSDEGNNEQTLNGLIKSTGSVAGAVKPLQKRLLSSDIALALTPDGVARAFEQMAQGLSAAKGGLPLEAKQAEVASAVADAAQEFLQTCQKEISHFAIGIRIDDDGNIDLGTWSIFVPAGQFTKAARDATAPEGNVMAGLPAERFWFAMGGVVPESWSSMVADLSLKFMKVSPGFDGMTDEQAAKLAEVSAKIMQGVNSMAMSMGAVKPGESMYANTFAVTRVKDSAVYLENSKKSFELMQQIGGEAEKLYEVKSLKIGSYDALEVTMNMVALAKAGGTDEATKKAMEKLVGPDGKLKTYLAAIDAKTVAFTYVNPDNIQRLATSIKAKDGGLVGDADVAVTAGLLPSGGQWAGYVSPTGFVDFVRMTLENAGPAVPKIPIPDFPKTPPIGATAKMLTIGMETHLVIPAKLLSTGGQYVKQFQGPPGMQIQIQPGGPGGPPVVPPPAPPAKPRRPAKK